MIVRDKAVMGGEAVFKGTRIPVRLVTAILDDGASSPEVLSGYPKLNDHDLAQAAIWVAANPCSDDPKPFEDDKLVLRCSVRMPLG